jgi:hypothetical protein
LYSNVYSNDIEALLVSLMTISHLLVSQFAQIPFYHLNRLEIVFRGGENPRKIGRGRLYSERNAIVVRVKRTTLRKEFISSLNVEEP